MIGINSVVFAGMLDQLAKSRECTSGHTLCLSVVSAVIRPHAILEYSKFASSIAAYDAEKRTH